MNQIIDNCNTDTTTAKQGGHTDYDCATYAYVARPLEREICLSDPQVYNDGDRKAYATFSLDQATSAIQQYCAQNLLADPAQKIVPFTQNGAYLTGMAWWSFLPPNAGVVIDIKITFADKNSMCVSQTPDAQKFNAGGDSCTRILTDLVNDCDTTSASTKWGGFSIESVRHFYPVSSSATAISFPIH